MTKEQWDFLVSKEKVINKIISIQWNKGLRRLFEPLKVDYDEFMNEARLQVFSNFSSWDSDRSGFETYCNTVITNKMRTYATSLNRTKRAATIYSQSLYQKLQDENETELIDSIKDTTDFTEISESEMSAHNILSSLKFQQDREITDLLMKGYSKEEVTQKLRITMKTLNWHITRMCQNAEFIKAINTERKERKGYRNERKNNRYVSAISN